MPSPLSNADKYAEPSRREDDLRKDDYKSYPYKDSRQALPPSRKGN